jgi:hypothetical protein
MIFPVATLLSECRARAYRVSGNKKGPPTFLSAVDSDGRVAYFVSPFVSEDDVSGALKRHHEPRDTVAGFVSMAWSSRYGLHSQFSGRFAGFDGILSHLCASLLHFVLPGTLQRASGLLPGTRAFNLMGVQDGCPCPCLFLPARISWT